MIETLNLILLKEFDGSENSTVSLESIEAWLKDKSNYERFQRECEKVWTHCSQNPEYNIARAFQVIGKRLNSIVNQSYE